MNAMHASNKKEREPLNFLRELQKYAIINISSVSISELVNVVQKSLKYMLFGSSSVFRHRY